VALRPRLASLWLEPLLLPLSDLGETRKVLPDLVWYFACARPLSYRVSALRVPPKTVYLQLCIGETRKVLPGGLYLLIHPVCSARVTHVGTRSWEKETATPDHRGIMARRAAHERTSYFNFIRSCMGVCNLSVIHKRCYILLIRIQAVG
jgi:hypothetical protein